jgi:hypothetical protein
VGAGRDASKFIGADAGAASFSFLLMRLCNTGQLVLLAMILSTVYQGSPTPLVGPFNSTELILKKEFIKDFYLYLHVLLSKDTQRQSLVYKNSETTMGTQFASPPLPPSTHFSTL